jgi:hypothetical protein
MKKVIAFSIALMPFLASAQLATGVQNVSSAFTFANSLLTSITVLLFAAAFVFFLYGVFQFVRAAGDEEARKTGRDHIIYGIIGLAVMASVYGLVNFLTGSANLTTTSVSVPALPIIPN